MSENVMTARTAPAFDSPRSFDDGITVLPGVLPVPELGELAVNAFILEGAAPILVDTGVAALREPFMDALHARIDVSRLHWIWLSHLDADHTGNLQAVLSAAPHATIVSSQFGRAKMMLQGLPIDRVHIVEAGQSLQTPDRNLQALRPPYYDAPETLGFFETCSRALFVADAFGAVLPHAPPEAEALDSQALRNGIGMWSSLDSPWLKLIRTDSLLANLDELDRLDPKRVLSAHLPSASALEPLTRAVATLYGACPTRAAA